MFVSVRRVCLQIGAFGYILSESVGYIYIYFFFFSLSDCLYS